MIKKMFSKLKTVLKRLYRIIRKPEMIILPGNLSFSLILSIFPAIMILGYIISKLNISFDMVIDLLNITLPQDIMDIIVKFLSAGISDGNIFLFIILAIIFASNGTYAIIVAANILYKNNNSNEIKRRIKALFLILIVMIIFFLTIIVLGFGSTILETITNLIEGNFDNLNKFFNIIRWPISFFVIFFFVKLIYTISPDFKIKSNTVNRGALFTTIGWIVVTFIYSIYVSNFARYDVFYGNLSSIIILMMWVYILSSIFVIGIAINADKYISENK